MFGYSKEAVRVKVKKFEGKLQPELRKFSVDPQITSLEVLQSILIKAFEIKSDYTLIYKTKDDCDREIHLPLLSDWDLDAAFLKAHNAALSQNTDPCVQLRIDVKPFTETTDEWESPTNNTAVNFKTSPSIECHPQNLEKQETQIGFQGIIMNHVEKTFNMVSKALNLYEDPSIPLRAPLSDVEFRSFLDPSGSLSNTTKLREVVYSGGIEPSLRKVVWKHILNVYPDGMTGKERMDYIKLKSQEYYTLRSHWKECIKKGQVNSNLAYVTSMVKKDVLRTDRHHNFYAGSDDNQNIGSLFNILTTYALYHPSVSYCQGMSDLASPLLVTMGDEAHAYICLCALMSRLYPNFLLDGEAMTLKFTHLTESLQVYDAEFYNYLKSHQADDLLFCYRWLLLEMKREFAFDDALIMLEVLWASLPQSSPVDGLSLKDTDFDFALDPINYTPPISPLIKTPRENPYTKFCSMRRQNSSFNIIHNAHPILVSSKLMNYSLDENVNRKSLVKNSLLGVKKFQSFDDANLEHSNNMIDDNNKDKKINPSDASNVNIKNSTIYLRRHTKCVPEQSAKSKLCWSSTGNLANDNLQFPTKDTPLANHIKLLKDKMATTNERFYSLDKLDITNGLEKSKKEVRLIKNFNEFLNFSSGSKESILESVKLQRTNSAKEVICKSEVIDKKSKSRELRKIHKNVTHNKPQANDDSSPDDSQGYHQMTTSMTREIRLELDNLNRQVFGSSYVDQPLDESLSDSSNTESSTNALENTKQAQKTHLECQSGKTESLHKKSTKELFQFDLKNTDEIYLWENPLHKNNPVINSCPQTPDEQAELDIDTDTGEIIEDNSGKKSITPIRLVRKKNSLEALPEDGNFNENFANASESTTKESVPPVKSNILGTPQQEMPSRSQKFFSSMTQELENARKNCESLLNVKHVKINSVASTINDFQRKYDVIKSPSQKNFVSTNCSSVMVKSISNLPPPNEFGGGNPFLMFLCLTVLLQHRDFIMRSHMDYNELAMHFDKMVRKHNVHRVLNQARQMYADYLKHQTQNHKDVNT